MTFKTVSWKEVPNAPQQSRKMVKMTAPKQLKRRWMTAALLALVCAPIEERSAVTQVPMLEPMTT